MKIIYEAHFGGESKATIICEGATASRVLKELNEALADMPRIIQEGNMVTIHIADRDKGG